MRAVAVRLSRLVWLAGLLIGVPAGLITMAGSPLPTGLPDERVMAAWLADPLTPATVARAVIDLVWVAWLVVAAALAVGLIRRCSGRRARVRLRLPAPARAMAAALLGTVAVTAADATGVAIAADVASTGTEPTRQDAMALAPSAAVAGGAHASHLVLKGEYLAKIARERLGDASRWRDICRLNWHRHFPTVGGTLRDCDLIYPGWRLRLPTDAEPTDRTTPSSPSAPSRPAEPDGVVPDPAAPPAGPGVGPSHRPPSATAPEQVAPSAIPGTTATAAAAPVPSLPTPAASASTAAGPTVSGSAADEHGVRLPDGSWITWTLAAAVTAAATLVWLQRRRPRAPDQDTPVGIPPPVVQLRHAVAGNPRVALPADRPGPTAAVAAVAWLPAGGLGLVGDGAHSAARAAIVAVLAGGDTHKPHARGEVVIDTAALDTLFGSDAALLSGWPGLHVAENLDCALTVIEARVLHRSRVLDEHALTDLDSRHLLAEDDDALPAVLFVADTPPPDARMRAEADLVLGAGLHMSALLLGGWAYGVIVEVTADGYTTPVCGQPVEPIPPRLPVLTTKAAGQILGTLREAHTGPPPAATHTAAVPPATDRAATTGPTTAGPVSGSGGVGKARLCVLGTPRIENIREPGRPLRAKALELAVLLACHPDGIATRDIGEHIDPDATVRQADQRVHTNASNLRHNLARTATGHTTGYLVTTAGRYRLDPRAVSVDVWQLRELLLAAGAATGEHRRGLLSQACTLYAAPLAEGQAYDWIGPHRQTVRRWGSEAHLMLADDLCATDPQAASDLLTKAISLDRSNETLYRAAMRARHALHDVDGIGTLLRALSKSLADLDAVPDEETITLAATLRHSLNHQ